ncbi:MAG: hypothetical protein ACRCZF_07155, partial [Gemmataceae bacterium]
LLMRVYIFADRWAEADALFVESAPGAFEAWKTSQEPTYLNMIQQRFFTCLGYQDAERCHEVVKPLFALPLKSAESQYLAAQYAAQLVGLYQLAGKPKESEAMAQLGLEYLRKAKAAGLKDPQRAWNEWMLSNLHYRPEFPAIFPYQ